MAEDKNLNLKNLIKYNEKIKEYISSHGGASEFKLVFLTKKAYDDLTEEEKMSDVNIYYIIDENGDFTNHVFLTQAAYNALGDKVLTDDVEYYITDAGSEEDLDELKREVNTLNQNLSEYREWKELTSDWTSYARNSVFVYPDNTQELYFLYKNSDTVPMSGSILIQMLKDALPLGIFIIRDNSFALNVIDNGNNSIKIYAAPSQGTNNVIRIYYR